MNDKYMEYFPIEGNTPSEVMENYTQLMNEKFAIDESVYSKRWKAMLTKEISAYWLETIKDEDFACIVWSPVRLKDREEFLGEEEI